MGRAGSCGGALRHVYSRREAPGDVPEDGGTTPRWTSRISRARTSGIPPGSGGALSVRTRPELHGVPLQWTQDRTGGGGANRFPPRHLRDPERREGRRRRGVQLYVRDDVSSVTTYVRICAGSEGSAWHRRAENGILHPETGRPLLAEPQDGTGGGAGHVSGDGGKFFGRHPAERELHHSTVTTLVEGP